MNWKPSVIKTHSKTKPADPQSRTRLLFQASHPLTDHKLTTVFAGAAAPQRLATRPVLLVNFYRNELLIRDTETDIVPNFLQNRKTLQVAVTDSEVSFNDISSAIKESMRMEKVIVQKLEQNEPVEQSEYLVTPENAKFVVGKHRLLGEILKAQRKAERLKPQGILRIQKSLELFIRKLCKLKVLAERLALVDCLKLF
ncbi:hypothetical protein NEDG_00393 [Nematocida displodere]|uniref:Uncharacterized protein n=1 Tax=Nematocida displodere TaxID=1805483 RepID=A0A177EJ74_9MICR|nr:hypothetical protein NEDG_00393 [Nematocida displodere]